MQVIDARAQGAGIRLGHASYPVHAARIGARASYALTALALLAGVGLAALSVTGVVTAQRLARSRGRRFAASSLVTAPPDPP